MADVAIGNPHTPGIVIRDSNGRLVTSGVTGTMTLYGPTSTAAIGGPSALAHFGGGLWGVTFPGALHTVAGLYKASTGDVSGAVALDDQTVLYTVGVPSPVHRTLGECVGDLAIELGWGLEGTSTGNGSTTTLVDSGRANANLSSDEWVDSELLILEPGAVGDRNPVTVTAFAPTTGTFTFTPPVTSTVTGQDYLILNARGNGQNFARLKRTIVAAWREVAPVQHVADELNFATDGTYALTVPAQWLGIEEVAARYGTSGPWSPIAEHYRPYDPLLRRINFATTIAAGQTLRVVGTIACAEPDALTSIVQVPYSWLRDRVLGELLAQSERREDQQRAAVHLERAERRRPRG